jgi:GLPGLI family protein
MKLKFSTLTIITLFFINNILFCQITKVTYKNGIYGKDINNLTFTKEKLNDIPVNEIKMAEAYIKSQADVIFELIYNDKSSLFKKTESLDIEEDANLRKFKNAVNSKQYYKNLETKEKLYQTGNSKLYNVSVLFDEYKWEITTETKVINGYKCYKAISTKEDINNPFKNRKLTFNIIAWFTPEIPSAFGPQGLDGLPGLVLEGSLNGKKYFYATKIEFNIDNLNIEKPKGENISESEYEKIILEEYKRMQEN